MERSSGQAPTADERRRAVRIFRLGDEPSDDLSDTTTAEERLAMLWELSGRAWALTGRPFASYRREEMPGRVIRPG